MVQRGDEPGEQHIRQVPVDITVLVGGVQLQLKPGQHVAYHRVQGVEEDPSAQAGQVAAVRLCPGEHAVQGGVHLVRLQRQDTPVVGGWRDRVSVIGSSVGEHRPTHRAVRSRCHGNAPSLFAMLLTAR